MAQTTIERFGPKFVSVEEAAAATRRDPAELRKLATFQEGGEFWISRARLGLTNSDDATPHPENIEDIADPTASASLAAETLPPLSLADRKKTINPAQPKKRSSFQLPENLNEVAELVQKAMTGSNRSLIKLLKGADGLVDSTKLRRILEAVLEHSPHSREPLSEALENAGIDLFDSKYTAINDLLPLLDPEGFLPEPEACRQLGIQSIADIDSGRVHSSDIMTLPSGTKYVDKQLVASLLEETLLRDLLAFDPQTKIGLARILGFELNAIEPFFMSKDGQPQDTIDIYELGKVVKKFFPEKVATVQEILRLQGKLDLRDSFTSEQAAALFGYEPSQFTPEEFGSEWFLSSWCDEQIGRIKNFDGVRYVRETFKGFLSAQADRVLAGKQLATYKAWLDRI